jgi:DNA-binding response OmpR family regulator
MDGKFVGRSRRAVPFRIIILSVRAEAVGLKRSRAAGAGDHVLKPFDLDDLVNRIARLTNTLPG